MGRIQTGFAPSLEQVAIPPEALEQEAPTNAAEFDDYAKEYSELLRNPVRDLFAADGLFFHRRKWEVLQTTLSARRVPVSTARWLDAGCGKGELLSLGASSFALALGCDTSAEMIGDRAGVFLQESPLELPFPDCCFDLVTAVCVYHHLEEKARQTFTGELFRVLRPGGLVCFMEHNPLNPMTQWIVSQTPVDANARLLTHWQIGQLARRAGFLKPQFQFFLFLPEKLHTRFPGLESLLGGVPVGGQYAAFCLRP